MSKVLQAAETQAFAQRLHLALKGGGVRPSPTVVANEFNLRYWGKSITPHTARSWLMGKSLPMQDKLRVLADWLHVSADELRFGNVTPIQALDETGFDVSTLQMQDREMIKRYLALPLGARKTACDVVAALFEVAVKTTHKL